MVYYLGNGLHITDKRKKKKEEVEEVHNISKINKNYLS